MNKEFSDTAQKNIGFDIEDLHLIGASPNQIKLVRKVLDDVIKNKKIKPYGEKVTFDSWKIWLMIFPSGLMMPLLKESDENE